MAESFVKQVKTNVDPRTLARIDSSRRNADPPQTRGEWLRAAIREKLHRDG